MVFLLFLVGTDDGGHSVFDALNHSSDGRGHSLDHSAGSLTLSLIHI